MWVTTGFLWMLLMAAITAKMAAAAEGAEPNSLEDVRRRLGQLVDRADEDSDGLLTMSELKEWIGRTSRRYIENDVSRLWKRLNPENNDTIHWDVYQETIYGHAALNDVQYYHKGLINRDRRRWKAADTGHDDSLNRDEFTAFLHSEDHPAMREVVLQEMFDDLDLDRDGKISLQEYLFDMYQPRSPDMEPPEWVAIERDVFLKFIDQDGDGLLNEAEVRQWIAPHGLGLTDSEAQHLLLEADVNGDAKLTKKEVLKKVNAFLNSPATEYGQALFRHDEL
ncbi:calumenin-A-like [Drosophila guanche]|uniref:Reticulocalbin-3 n=1 Tax=Drosophila guanche TaxID=7266 RepID=A0A3B0KPT0_DROGU|nr:calumenin-A-like [Drosophila guanche]SPP88619.1 blast:Transmembrane protein 201 [Drosophila guanche]